MKTTDTSEKGLEIIIENYLVDHNGYQQSYSIDYDRDLCINTKILLEFIQETQPDAYSTIVNRGEEKFTKRLSEQIKKKGIIEVLRNGIKDLDLKVNLYYKNPTSDLNQAAKKKYESNVFSITRQLF